MAASSREEDDRCPAAVVATEPLPSGSLAGTSVKPLSPLACLRERASGVASEECGLLKAAEAGLRYFERIGVTGSQQKLTAFVATKGGHESTLPCESIGRLAG